jgi:hypothetical protein
MEDEITFVEKFDERWPSVEKDAFCSMTYDGKTCLFFACEIEEFRLVVKVIIGVRKGLTEEVIAIDTSEKFTIDRLHLREHIAMGDGLLLPLSEMRHQIRQLNRDPALVCIEELISLYWFISSEPESFVRRLRLIERLPRSVSTIGSGLPTLGKRR